MKVGFRKGLLKDIEKTGSNGLIVAYRAGSLIRTMNLSCEPKDGFKLENNNGELVIRVSLRDNEYFVIEDQTGDADKGILE